MRLNNSLRMSMALTIVCAYCLVTATALAAFNYSNNNSGASSVKQYNSSAANILLPERKRVVTIDGKGDYKEIFQDSCKMLEINGVKTEICGNENDILRHAANKLESENYACGINEERSIGIYGFKGSDGAMRYYMIDPFYQSGNAASVEAHYYDVDYSLGVKAECPVL